MIGNNKRESLLRERLYQGKLPTKPSISLVLKEWYFAINIFRNKESAGALIWLLYYIATGLITVVFFMWWVSLESVLILIIFLLIQANIFHTFWYHRYATHRAFQFRKKFFTIPFKWLNPLAIKEEIYIIPHIVHHQYSDSINDPYGPHLGFLASFLSAESQHFFNRQMSKLGFDFCIKSLRHIPSRYCDYNEFQKHGSFERSGDYVMRLVLMIAFWSVLLLFLLQSTMLFYAFFSSVFIFITIMRDFNYRGHAEKLSDKYKSRIDHKSNAVNQTVYGILASEWHENHHRYSSSARCGFEVWQVDISFLFTRLLHKLGIITSYNDAYKSYMKHKIAKDK